MESMTAGVGGLPVADLVGSTDVLTNPGEIMLVFHEFSLEFVNDSADMILDCGLVDEVQDFHDTPVDVPVEFEQLVEMLEVSFEELPPEAAALTDSCLAIPALETLGRFKSRLLSLEDLIQGIEEMDGLEMLTMRPDLLVVLFLYGSVLEFTESTAAIFTTCGMEDERQGWVDADSRDASRRVLDYPMNLVEVEADMRTGALQEDEETGCTLLALEFPPEQVDWMGLLMTAGGSARNSVQVDFSLQDAEGPQLSMRCTRMPSKRASP